MSQRSLAVLAHPGFPQVFAAALDRLVDRIPSIPTMVDVEAFSPSTNSTKENSHVATL
jgi:hypothetical protein